MNERIETFRKDVGQKLPGILSFFDFADFKRRNMHIGYAIGDRDIEEFEAILENSLSEVGCYLRYGGGKWLVYVRNTNLDILKLIISSFSQRQPVEVGWKCNGRKGDLIKSRETIINNTIHRSVRCSFELITDVSEFENLLDRLHEYVQFCDVDSPNKLSEIEKAKANRWQCINYPGVKRDCIFCGSTQFEYLGDGCGPILEMECNCKDCGAYLEYVEIFRPKNT